MRPLALVALSDELRPEAGAVLEALAAQGIRFKILSGDNPETVRATVGHLAIAAGPRAGRDRRPTRSCPGPDALPASTASSAAWRRGKSCEIVAALQAAGHHVAMIGDGINDVLPIKQADLGIAMGEGSGAAQTVAGLVLENNNFGLLPATLDEGRHHPRTTCAERRSCSC